MDCLVETKMSVLAGKERLVKERRTEGRVVNGTNATEVPSHSRAGRKIEALPSLPCCRRPNHLQSPRSNGRQRWFAALIGVGGEMEEEAIGAFSIRLLAGRV